MRWSHKAIHQSTNEKSAWMNISQGIVGPSPLIDPDVHHFPMRGDPAMQKRSVGRSCSRLLLFEIVIEDMALTVHGQSGIGIWGL